jgi:hypothetical protein
MAIIAVLSGIIFAVFSKVMARAKSMSCLNNVSQIGKALRLYAESSDDLLPPYATKTVCGLPDDLVYEPAKLKSALMPYLGSEKVCYCPEDHHARSAADTGCGEDNLHWSYEYSIPLFMLRKKEQGSLDLAWGQVPFSASTSLLEDKHKLIAGPADTPAHDGKQCTVYFDLHSACVTIPKQLEQRKIALSKE